MIGLEIHCQLTNLQSKLFCPCKANYRGSGTNENVCPTCMGLPGSLPALNREAVRNAAMIAMALGCTTPPKVAFFRKNYFYPDLPKNFQITQLNIYGETSMGGAGAVVAGGKRIRIARVQLEEDPGRLVYEGTQKNRITLVDYNRAGTPLVEIVTEPDFEDPRQVREFLNILSDLLENLGVSDPGLEGAMRADANVSVRGGSKVEVKNINSFADLEKAIHYELTRQNALYDRGHGVSQETRHWDDRRRITTPSRSKEEAHDYRYFLEGDIPWVVIDGRVRDGLRASMPESISSKKGRYASEYGIPEQVAGVLSSDKFYSGLFDAACTPENAKEVANIITTDLMGLVDTKERRGASKVTPQHVRDLADRIISGGISRASARAALPELVRTGRAVSELVSEMGLGAVSDESELAGIVGEVLAQEGDAARQARANPQAVNYLVGMVMKRTGGRADPKVTLGLIKKGLGKLQG